DLCGPRQGPVLAVFRLVSGDVAAGVGQRPAHPHLLGAVWTIDDISEPADGSAQQEKRTPSPLHVGQYGHRVHSHHRIGLVADLVNPVGIGMPQLLQRTIADVESVDLHAFVLTSVIGPLFTSFYLILNRYTGSSTVT